MKLHLDTASGLTAGSNLITAHGDGFVAVNGGKIPHPVIVLPETLINPWKIASPGISAPSLCIADFAELLALKPELVLFGSGAKFCFPVRAVMLAFSQARIGFEVMDTPAACRTYNVLTGEGRRIAAALLISSIFQK